ncbi:MAG: hypothetical protein ABH845_05155 [Candidatus Omnitrophota bacterium]
MIGVFFLIFVFTTVIVAISLDPKVKHCEYCEGPVTLKELWRHTKKCPGRQKGEKTKTS